MVKIKNICWNTALSLLPCLGLSSLFTTEAVIPETQVYTEESLVWIEKYVNKLPNEDEKAKFGELFDKYVEYSLKPGANPDVIFGDDFETARAFYNWIQVILIALDEAGVQIETKPKSIKGQTGIDSSKIPAYFKLRFA